VLDPIKGFDKGACQDEEQAGKEPADHLGIYRVPVMMAADLPVGINAQAAENAADRANDHDQIGHTEIPATDLLGDRVKITDAGRLLCHATKWQGKKEDSQGCLQVRIGMSHVNTRSRRYIRSGLAARGETALLD
jgi:hypothetical protein